MRTRVWTITCPKCHVEMYSRAQHDYRVCGCPVNMMVDGGFAGSCHWGSSDAYFAEVKRSFRHRFVNATKQELYDDWNYRKDKLGTIARKRG